jgi:hypothetical protein
MVQAPQMAAGEQGPLLQVALKTNQTGMLYINDAIPPALLAPQPTHAAPLGLLLRRAQAGRRAVADAHSVAAAPLPCAQSLCFL